MVKRKKKEESSIDTAIGILALIKEAEEKGLKLPVPNAFTHPCANETVIAVLPETFEAMKRVISGEEPVKLIKVPK